MHTDSHRLQAIYDISQPSRFLNAEYYHLPGRAATAFSDHYILVVFFNLTNRCRKGQSRYQQCKFIKIAGNNTVVCDVHGTKECQTPFLDWLKNLVKEDFEKARQQQKRELVKHVYQ